MWVLMVKLMKKYHWSSPTLWGRDYTLFWGPKLQSQPAVFAVWLILISKTFTFFTFASSLLFSLQLPCDCQPGAGDVTVAFDLDGCRYFCTNFSRNLPEVQSGKSGMDPVRAQVCTTWADFMHVPAQCELSIARITASSHLRATHLQFSSPCLRQIYSLGKGAGLLSGPR